MAADLKTEFRGFVPSQSWSLADATRSKVLYLSTAVFLSIVAGLVLTRVPHLLVIGAVGAALGAYVVLRFPFIGLLLYTILFMWRPAEVYPVLAALRLERIVGVLTLVAMVVERYRATGSLTLDWSRLTRLLLLIGLAVLVSVPLAYWRQAAMDGLITFLKLLTWYLLVAHLLTSRTRFRVYLTVFLVAICKLAFDSLRAYFAGNYKYAQGIERVVGQTDAAGDPNTLAATCAATIPILLLIAFIKPYRWYRLPPALAAGLLTVTLALTGSRGGLLAFLASGAYLVVGLRHRVIVGLVGVALLAGGAIVLPNQYKVRYSSMTSSELDASSQGRVGAWKKGVRMVLDRPLTGVGISCFSTASALGYSHGSRPSSLQPHSVYVQIPAEIGLLGALFFFLYVREMFRAAADSRRGFGRQAVSWNIEMAVVRGVSAALVALLVAGVFGHSFMRYTWYVYGALLVALIRLRPCLQTEALRRCKLPTIANWPGSSTRIDAAGAPNTIVGSKASDAPETSQGMGNDGRWVVKS